MVTVSPAPELAIDKLNAFYTTDPLLANSPVLVLYGDSSSSTATPNASGHVQCHVITAAGLQSYPRLSISPGSPLYAAVTSLPRDEQGDEICRAIAFGIYKYFTELSEATKDAWMQQSSQVFKAATTIKLFGEKHAANLAKSMKKLDGAREIMRDIQLAFADVSLSYIDVDLALPAGSSSKESVPSENASEDVDTSWGVYDTLVDLFGEVAFLPTSKIRRAPSRPTALNRSLTFTNTQRENLAREMQEFIETEEHYVEKLRQLVEDVAQQFRQGAKAKTFNSSSPDEDRLAQLFPKCLDEILQVNSALLGDLRTCRTSIDFDPTGANPTQDATGSLNFAKCLISHFPKFDAPYGEYIHAHAHFSQTLRGFLSNKDSSFSKRVQDVGEQRLMSMLIEPVQRLPRYILYIENMAKQLPDRHPALRPLLKAKDCVANTCASDAPSLHRPSQAAQLKTLVYGWPGQLKPSGRLVSTVDAVELQSPFEHQRDECKLGAYIILLYPEHLIFVQKAGSDAVNARRLLTELEKTSPIGPSDSSNALQGLRFSGWTAISNVSCFEAAQGTLIRLSPSSSCNKHLESQAIAADDAMAKDARLRTFYLGGVFEQKAARWTLDFVKARIEGRFTEIERESTTWQARCCESKEDQLGLFVAVFEQRDDNKFPDRKSNAPIRVLIDPNKHSTASRARGDGTNIIIHVTVAGEGFYQLEVEADTENRTRDLVTRTEFLPVLTKRVGAILQMKNSMRNTASAAYLLQHHQGILQSLKLDRPRLQRTPSKSRHFRPPSPVKAITGLFAGGSKDVEGTKSPAASASVFDDLVRIPAPTRVKSHAQLRSNTESVPKVNIVREQGEKPLDPLAGLEATFESYVLALHARKGNIVGRIVANRHAAEEASVNELYNMLLDNPSNHEQAAQSSIDVLFAAWEKFLKSAWHDHLGPVLTGQTLMEMQYKAETLSAYEYEDYLGSVLAALKPQNRMALRATIGLLANLLDGTSNDGDRGALTAAVTEILVCEQQPIQFMSLIDRLVADYDVVSGNTGSHSRQPSAFNSITSSHMSKHGKSGSISSKASSLSKRFGLGSLRRTGSKKVRGISPGPEAIAGTPSSGTDYNDGDSISFSSRPGSRDQKTAGSSFTSSRPQSAHSDKVPAAVSAVSDFAQYRLKTPPRKKRRSSLSDLQLGDSPSTTPAWSNSPYRADNAIEPRLRPEMRGPLAPSPLSIRSGTPQRYGSVRLTTQVSDPTSRLASSPMVRTERPLAGQENRPPSRFAATLARHGSQVPSASENPSRRSHSPLPPPPNVLGERADAGNTSPRATAEANKQTENSPTKQPGIYKSSSRAAATRSVSPTKPRLAASASKTRERLDAHKTSVQATSSTLQSELDKIGEELSRHNNPSSKAPAAQVAGTQANLNTRLKALETKLPNMVSNLQIHSEKLEKEMQISLTAHASQIKDLNAQLKTKELEIEALYVRMNSELERMFSRVQEGDGAAEMRRQLKENASELSKYRRENARLTRENTALRAGFSED